MSKTLKILLYAFISLLLISTICAQGFEAELKPVKDKIYLDEVAIYNLTIKNNADNDETYQIYTPDISWIIDTTPSLVKVETKNEETFVVTVDPKTYVSTGQHAIKLNVKATSTKRFVQLDTPIYVKSSIPDTRTYEPSIEVKIDMPKNIDPRENVPIEVSLRNRNNLDIEKLEVVMSSNLIHKEYSIPFSGLEERTDEFLFQLNNIEEPQEDELVITLYKGDRKVNQVTKPFKIIAYSDLIEDVNERDGFLTKIYDVEIRNDGNVQKEGEYKLKSSFFKSLVTFSNIRPIKPQEEKGYFVWEYTLEPQETVNINIIFNYGMYIYLLLAIIVAVILYYLFRSPLIMRKEAKVIGSFEEGVSEIKVMIHLKNRGQKELENIRITEKIPRLVKFEKGSYVGTLAPDKIIEHAKIGTTIRWNLKTLEPFEERIITYKIKSKLNIVGGFTLPKVIIRFDTLNGKERVGYSNRCKIIT